METILSVTGFGDVHEVHFESGLMAIVTIIDTKFILIKNMFNDILDQ